MDRPWVEEDDALLRQFYEEGLSASTMSARLIRTRNAVLGRINRLIDKGALTRRTNYSSKGLPLKGARKMPAVAQCQFILKAAESGQVDREIAAQLGLTIEQVRHIRRKNGIASKATRPCAAAENRDKIVKLAAMGLSDVEIGRRLKLTDSQVRTQRRNAGVTHNGQGPRPGTQNLGRIVNIQKGDGGMKVLAVFAEGFMGQQGRVSLVDLGAGMCRFPIDQTKGPVRYCGLEAPEGSSWCEHHRRRCGVEAKGPKAGVRPMHKYTRAA